MDSLSGLSAVVVHACLREGRGGSPTAVVVDRASLDDAARRRVPGLTGASHAVFLGEGGTVRFFTAEGELPACGHGTVAALALLGPGRATLRAVDGRLIEGSVRTEGALPAAEFGVGAVVLREPQAAELGEALDALGLRTAAASCVAGVGRARLLLQVPGRPELAALRPDLDALEAACRRHGLLGCYVYAAPERPERRFAARMFAPAIGVPEDIANANSTACLAAFLRAHGEGLAVDMGDSLGSPATVTAALRPDGTVRVGGVARIGETVALG